MEKTDRLSLPLLIAGQAQKEVFHNEALLILDALVAGCVEIAPSNTPPANPVPGQCYIIGTAPTGEWQNYPDHVAAYLTAGWRFMAPRAGLTMWEKSSDVVARFTAAGWEIGVVRGEKLMVGSNQVVGPRAAAIADPTGGGVVDIEGRSALVAVLGALRQHGLISP